MEAMLQKKGAVPRTAPDEVTGVVKEAAPTGAEAPGEVLDHFPRWGLPPGRWFRRVRLTASERTSFEGGRGWEGSPPIQFLA